MGAEARLVGSKVLWQFDMLRVPGETLNMEGLERELLHCGFQTKSQVRVQFLPVQQKI